METAVDRRSPSPTSAEVELPIAGMTCASCVNRIERFLKKTDGVEGASVNLATEIATIRYLPDVTGRAELGRAIEAAGSMRRHGAPLVTGARRWTRSSPSAPRRPGRTASA